MSKTKTLMMKFTPCCFNKKAQQVAKLLLAFFLPIYTVAQTNTFIASFGETEHFRIEELVLPGGRGANNANCIVQGPDGFLWIGSQDGLHRYDGHETVTYRGLPNDTLDQTGKLTFSYIESLYWDQHDQLWVGTYGGGLYCFDPQTEQFKHYKHDPEDPGSISSDAIVCAIEDAAGNLWFGTVEGLNRFDRKTQTFVRYLPEPGREGSLSHPHVRNLYIDKQNTLWVATGIVFWVPEEGGLNRYNPQTDSFTTFSYDPEDPASLWTNAVQGMAEDESGNFWVATTGGLQKMDREKGTFERMQRAPGQPYAPGTGEREKPSAYSLIIDRTGGIWVGTIGAYDYPSHLLRYDPRTRTTEEFPIRTAAWHLCESRDGTIWVSGAGEGGGKVLKITPKAPASELLQGTHLFNDFKRTATYQQLHVPGSEDRWLGPYAIGFSQNDPENFWLEYIYVSAFDNDPTAYAILAQHQKTDRQTRFFHLDSLDIRKTIPLDNEALLRSGMGMLVDKAGRVWGTFPSDNVGVYCFDPENGQTVHYQAERKDSTSLMSNQVLFVMRDKTGHIWAAQREKGLSRLDTDTQKWIHFRPDSKPSMRIGGYDPITIAEGADGRIWTGGLTKDNRSFITALDLKTGTTKDYPAPLNQPVYNYPRSFTEIGQSLFFSLYVNGFGELKLQDNSTFFKHYSPEKNNFPFIGIADMIPDQFGSLWIASNTNNLLARLDPQSEQWTLFRNNNTEPTLNRASRVAPDGHLFFLHPGEGWSELDPEQLLIPESGPDRLHLTNVYFSDHWQKSGNGSRMSGPIHELEQLVLPEKALPFGFRFSSFHFSSPVLAYQYRLFPYEKEWSVSNGIEAIRYNAVPVGTYQFQVRGYNQYGLVDDESIDLVVTIQPHWWKTWWAITLFGVLLISLLGGFYYYQRYRWKLQMQLQLEHERAERLRDLNQFKSRFYTNITHEFRTPLTVIKGMSEQIEGNEKARILIRRNSDRLLDMVNQLLDLSKLETNSLKINWIQGDVVPLLRYLTESCHSLAYNKKISLSFFSKIDSILMDYDEDKLQKILLNLISNAIKFTPEYGQVKVVVDKTLQNGQAFLCFSIEDTGSGITPDQLPHIFNRFYQGDDDHTLQREGWGVGLALVKELVQLLSGSIEVQSEYEKGSVFQVVLPIHQLAPMSKSSKLKSGVKEKTAAITIPPSDLGNKDHPLVLVIEDNYDVVEYIFTCLQSDYRVLAARNGKQGLEKAIKEIPDVVICDVMMPEMDGFEVCRRLKTDRCTSHIPVILLTAKATQEDKNTGLLQGADAYLTKPFDQNELLIRLENLTTLSRLLRDKLANPSELEVALTTREQQESDFLQEVRQLIDDNLSDESFNTAKLCREIAMSRAQLYRKLKALTGKSTAWYIRTIRLRKAKQLLEDTDLPIGEIAQRVGFKDFSHFSRSFSKEFDQKPSDTRS